MILMEYIEERDGYLGFRYAVIQNTDDLLVVNLHINEVIKRK